jgi:hypothetical protein
MAGARHGMCEFTRRGEKHGHGMGTAWARHGMCELALIPPCIVPPPTRKQPAVDIAV